MIFKCRMLWSLLSAIAVLLELKQLQKHKLQHPPETRIRRWAVFCQMLVWRHWQRITKTGRYKHGKNCDDKNRTAVSFGNNFNKSGRIPIIFSRKNRYNLWGSCGGYGPSNQKFGARRPPPRQSACSVCALNNIGAEFWWLEYDMQNYDGKEWYACRPFA